jgi:hypothetical protein
MTKKTRLYIPVSLANKTLKVYIQDVAMWRKVIKKPTPRLPAYDDCQIAKWE